MLQETQFIFLNSRFEKTIAFLSVNLWDMLEMKSPELQAKRGTLRHILLCKDSRLQGRASLIRRNILLMMACVTIQKKKLSHWCGQDTGSHGTTTCVYRKILYFPSVTAATGSCIIFHNQDHLKVIPRHSHWPETILLYGTVNARHSHAPTHMQCCVQCGCTQTHTKRAYLCQCSVHAVSSIYLSPVLAISSVSQRNISLS